MIRPIRLGVGLALLSAFGAAVSTFLVPWIVRFSMTSASIFCVLLALVLALSTRTHPVRVQRRAARLNARMLRAGSILVGLSAFKIGIEFYGDTLITGISEWLVILAIVHCAISAWDLRAFRHSQPRWNSRKIYGVVHLALFVGLTALHILLLQNQPV